MEYRRLFNRWIMCSPPHLIGLDPRWGRFNSPNISRMIRRALAEEIVNIVLEYINVTVRCMRCRQEYGKLTLHPE